MRRIPTIATVIALTVSACTEPLPTSTEAAAMTPFTWKADTPRATRGADIFSCELAARGLPPNATPEMIESAVRADPEQEASFVRRCLTNKGYTVTELPVCNSRNRGRGQLVVQPDILPPLQSIRCVDPTARGFVVG
ncbi:MAG: hypothetical protein AAGB10_19760 [Pseudomonadota bacterium]